MSHNCESNAMFAGVQPEWRGDGGEARPGGVQGGGVVEEERSQQENQVPQPQCRVLHWYVTTCPLLIHIHDDDKHSITTNVSSCLVFGNHHKP